MPPRGRCASTQCHGLVRQVLAKNHLLGTIERLFRNRHSRYRHERCVGFAPLDRGILDRHAVGSRASLHHEVEFGVAFRQMPHQVGAQKIRIVCGGERGVRASRTGRELARRVAAETVGGHAPVAKVQRVQRLVGEDRDRHHEFMQPPAQRIETGKKEIQQSLSLQVDVVDRVAHHEDRVVDQDEVLCRGRARRHVHQLDRHAAAIELAVGLRRAGAVGEADPRIVSARFGKHADAQMRRQVVEHVELRAHDAVRLGVGVAAGQSRLGRVADLRFDDLCDHADGVGFSGRYDLAGDRGKRRNSGRGHRLSALSANTTTD